MFDFDDFDDYGVRNYDSSPWYGGANYNGRRSGSNTDLLHVVDNAVMAVEDPIRMLAEGVSSMVRWVGSAIAHGVAKELSLEEWGQTASKVIDRVKDQIIVRENLRFIGGYLHFSVVPPDQDQIAMSYDLYFQDPGGNWRKAEKTTKFLAANLAAEDFRDLCQNGKITFEVN